MTQHIPSHPVESAAWSEEDHAIRRGLIQLAEQDGSGLPPLPAVQRVWNRHRVAAALAARARDLWIAGSTCLAILFVTAVLAWRFFPKGFPNSGSFLMPILTIAVCLVIALIGFFERSAHSTLKPGR